jgi:hypothetical protein
MTKAGSPPSPVEAYAGTYRDPWRGEVTVDAGTGGMRIRFSKTNRLVGRLHYYRGDTFVVRWEEKALGEDAFVHFERNSGGQLAAIRIESLPSSEGDLDFQNLRLTTARQRPDAKGSASAQSEVVGAACAWPNIEQGSSCSLDVKCSL